MKMLENNGPKIDPWGTPVEIWRYPDDEELICYKTVCQTEIILINYLNTTGVLSNRVCKVDLHAIPYRGIARRQNSCSSVFFFRMFSLYNTFCYTVNLVGG